MVPLEEVEAKDPPKFDLFLDASGKQAPRPEWKAGYYWEYSVTGGKTIRRSVLKTGNYRNASGYQVTLLNGKEGFLDQSLGLMAVFDNSIVDTDYEPALHPFDFPLLVGKSWHASSKMRRTPGSINLSTNYEIKGYGKIKVQAGEFIAFYILGRSDYGSRVNELWYSPEIRYFVKSILYTNNGKVTEELSAFNLD